MIQNRKSMKDIALSETERNRFGQIMDYVTGWCSENGWVVGIGEMAAGAGLIAAGIQIGHIHIGTDVFGTTVGGFNVESLAAAGGGASAGGVAGTVLGSIGVVPFGGIGVPAWLMIAGGAGIFGAAGYSVGDAVHNFLNPAIDLGQFFAGASLLTIGTALLIDRARRVITNEGFKQLLSDFRDGIIRLAELTAKVVVDSFDALKTFLESFAPTGPADAAGSAATGAAGEAAGAALGGTVATGSVTILGSHALGDIALSLGLVSAPLWPVIAGGAAGLAVGYGAWRAVRFFGRK